VEKEILEYEEFSELVKDIINSGSLIEA